MCRLCARRDLDDVDWDQNDTESTPGGAIAFRAREVKAISIMIQKLWPTAVLRVRKTVTDSLYELVEAPVAVHTAPTLTISPGAGAVSSQADLLQTDLSKTQFHLQARESKLNPDLQKADDRCAELETSLYQSRLCLLKLKKHLAKLKVMRTKALKKLTRRHAAESCHRPTAFRREVVILKKAGLRKKEDSSRLKEVVKHEQQKALTQHEPLVDQHTIIVYSLRRRADTAEKTAAAVEEHLQAAFAQFSGSHGQVRQVVERITARSCKD